jgi:nitrite reductase (NADH) small subunit
MSVMNKPYKLGTVSQIPPGEGRNFSVGDCKLAVFHTRDGGIYATQASCPHRQGPLADGLLGRSTLVCPLHELQFDLSTGKSVNGQCDIAVYPVTRGPDDQLTVELPDEGLVAAE